MKRKVRPTLDHFQIKSSLLTFWCKILLEESIVPATPILREHDCARSRTSTVQQNQFVMVYHRACHDKESIKHSTAKATSMPHEGTW